MRPVTRTVAYRAVAASAQAGDLTVPLNERLGSLAANGEFMNKVYSVDITPFCTSGAAHRLALFDCSAYVSSAALMLSTYPFTASISSEE